MASKCSIASAVAWNWVIEALPSSEQPDLSTLIERCEDVLKKILDEVPKPMTKLENEKWDLGSFLKHKRSSSPKCSLTKLKEAILDENNPLFASLKEKSKFLENMLQDDIVPQETYTEGHNKRVVSVDSMGNLEFVVKTKDSDILQPNNEKANDDDDRTGIVAKKEAFLKSRCKTGQDSLNLTTELPQNPIPQPTNPKQKCKEKESQRSTESSLTIRLCKRKAKHSPPPPVPSLRRRKLPWTKSEVEMLKEGVEKYSSGNNTRIPWKKILDFGHNVFNEGRTAIDLKDKWRNICK